MQEVYPEVQVRIPLSSLVDPCFAGTAGFCIVPKIVKFPSTIQPSTKILDRTTDKPII